MQRPLLALAIIAAASPAFAWENVDGGSMTRPVETNSNVEALYVHCLDGPALDLYAKDGAPVLPADGSGQADYFYKPGAVRAEVDGKFFPLVAAGSDIAVVLFSEGTAAQNYMAPVDTALFDAMFVGRMLTISLDITPAAAANGSPLETFVRFDLQGAGPFINNAIDPCS